MANAQQRVARGPVYDAILDLQKQVNLLTTQLATVAGQALLIADDSPGSAKDQRIQLVRDPRYAQDAVNLRTLQAYIRNAFEIQAEETAAEIAGESEALIPVPNLLAIVEAYAAANPAQLANSCLADGGTWDFMDGVVAALQAADERVGWCGQRGDPNDPAEDAISYWTEPKPLPPIAGEIAGAVIDIIGSHCPGPGDPAPYAKWQPVATAGAVWLPVRPV